MVEDRLSLENILDQLDDEESAEVFGQWTALIQQRAAHCADAARLAIAAEDLSGIQYWSAQLHECTAAIEQIRERIRHLRDATSLELQWLLDSCPPPV
jgi:hypothetical protein